MTTKQIAQAVGRSERRVQEWAKRTGAKTASVGAKIAQAHASGKAADYDLEETCLVIETGLGKNAAGIYRANAARDVSPAPQISDRRLDRLEVLVERLLGAVVSFVPASGAPRPQAALSEPPELGPRAALKKVVEGWARSHGKDYHEAWSNLYREYNYRYQRDIARIAKQRGLSGLDYAEDEELLGQLLALAYFLYGQKETVKS
jgi:transposase